MLVRTKAIKFDPTLNLPLNRSQLIGPLTITLIAVLFYLAEHQLLPSLVFQKQAIANGEFWRLITGHFFHTNLNHLLLNLAGMWLLWSLHGEYYTAKRYASLVMLAALVTSIGIYNFSDITQYVGLSGLLHGVFIWGAILDIVNKLKSGYLLLLGVIVKVVHEQFYGASEGVSALINANVAIDAHLWGTIGGVLFFLVGYRKFVNSTL